MLKEKLLDKIEYLYNQKQYEKLIKKCDALLEIDSDNPIALNYKAISLYYLGNYDESMKLLDYNLKLHPTNYYTLNNMALVHIALGKYQKALDCCEEGLKYKKFDWLLINKIETLIHSGREYEAYEFYKSVEIPYYTFEDALNNCGKLQSDDVFKRLELLSASGKFEEILQICEEYESNERATDYKIGALIGLERFDEALSSVSKAIENWPYNYNFYLIKAKICIKCRRLDEAIGSYEKAFEVTGSVSNFRLHVNDYIRCLNIKAHQFIELGNYSSAIKVCEKILKYRPAENAV